MTTNAGGFYPVCGEAVAGARAEESAGASRCRALGAIQCQSARQGRASVPGAQAAVRLYEGALSRPSQEHRAGADAVCLVELVDDAPAVVASDGIRSSVRRGKRAKCLTFAAKHPPVSPTPALRPEIPASERVVQGFPNAIPAAAPAGRRENARRWRPVRSDRRPRRRGSQWAPCGG